MIHPTAIIHAQAQVDPSTDIGPYCVIDEAVVVGPNCVLGPHVHLTGQTIIGANNRFHAGAVIGDAPQDLKYHGEPTRLRVGDGNVFREGVTIHRSNKMEADTVIGNENYFMASSHVGHNAIIGNQVILANGALVAGHVEIADRVFISGNCMLHQFVRVGTLAIMQGGSGISKDLPPYTVARGNNHICGLNVVGLRRAGLSAAQRLELKQLYHLLFRSRKRMAEALAEARATFADPLARGMLDFVAGSKRGVCADISIGDGANPAELEA